MNYGGAGGFLSGGGGFGNDNYGGGYNNGGNNYNNNYNQGGYNNNQGGFNNNQGGYNNNQGGYNNNQGGYNNNQGGNYGGGNRFGSEAKGNANASPFKTDQKKRGSIVPLTIKALLEIASRQDDILEIDGAPVEQAVVVGRVYNVEEQTTRVTFFLDDSTGRTQIAYYKKPDTNGEAAGFEISDLRDNKYVKAVIVVRPFKTAKTLVAHQLQQIADYNQVTYHLLSTFLSSAYRTKGPLEKSDPNFQDKNAQNNNNNNNSFNNRNQGQEFGQYQQNNFNDNPFPQSNAQPKDPMTEIRNAIQHIMDRDGNGLCFKSRLTQVLQGRVRGDILENALIQLENNGQIYRGRDDERDPGYVLI